MSQLAGDLCPLGTAHRLSKVNGTHGTRNLEKLLLRTPNANASPILFTQGNFRFSNASTQLPHSRQPSHFHRLFKPVVLSVSDRDIPRRYLQAIAACGRSCRQGLHRIAIRGTPTQDDAERGMQDGQRRWWLLQAVLRSGGCRFTNPRPSHERPTPRSNLQVLRELLLEHGLDGGETLLLNHKRTGGDCSGGAASMQQVPFTQFPRLPQGVSGPDIAGGPERRPPPRHLEACGHAQHGPPSTADRLCCRAARRVVLRHGEPVIIWRPMPSVKYDEDGP